LGSCLEAIDRFLESFMMLKKTAFQKLLILHLTLMGVVKTLAEVIYHLIVLDEITLMQRLIDEQRASW